MILLAQHFKCLFLDLAENVTIGQFNLEMIVVDLDQVRGSNFLPSPETSISVVSTVGIEHVDTDIFGESYLHAPDYDANSLLGQGVHSI